MCAILIFWSSEPFFKFSVAEEKLFPSSRFGQRTLLKPCKRFIIFGQFRVYICEHFFKFMVKLDVDGGKFVGRCTKRLGTKAAFSSKPVCTQRKKKKDKKQWDKDHKRISVVRDVHESLKKIKCRCLYSSRRRTRPSLKVASQFDRRSFRSKPKVSSIEE